MKRFHIKFFLCALAFTACGGGTAGTSPTGEFGKVFQGVVLAEDGSVVPDARVSVAKTSYHTKTDSSGHFSLAANLSGDDATIEVSKANKKAKVGVSNLSNRTSIVGVNVQLGETQNNDDFELAIDSIGDGACEGAFGPAKVVTFATNTPPLVVIGQENPIPSGTTCTIHVRIARHGELMANNSFQLVNAAGFFTADSNGLPILSQGVTDESGTGSLTFTLGVGVETTDYLILEAPLDVPSGERVGIVISFD